MADAGGNPMEPGGPPRRPTPLPAPSRPDPEAENLRRLEREQRDREAAAPETSAEDVAEPSTRPTTDAATLATLIATADQHSAEIEALARAQRLMQRNLLLMTAVLSYIAWRNFGGIKETVSEGVRDAVAGPATP